MKGLTTTVRSAPSDRIHFKLEGRSVALDRRVHAARGDLADLSLAGTLFSAHYARAVELTCVASGVPVLAQPSTSAQAISELLRGEHFHALDVTTDWAWGFCGHDGYVGYVRREALDVLETATHRIVAAAAPLFSQPDIKSPIIDYWPRGALFGATEQEDFLAAGDGFVHVRHAAAVDALEQDWVEVALRYLGQPYVWGGRGHRGVDCSGLVQVALGQCGIAVPRDTDLQCEGIGSPVPAVEPLRRGDLVFFPGHVGFMADSETLLHANAHWMAVVTEPLADVVARLAASHPEPIIARRRIGA
ncbi:C40 family peptidase [Sphingobium ummariense]|uniref:Glycoside hydrolase n=1 Tax=Sphingobium ummariense RL-3 TaxID=1346791 RepID=T0KG72_9SPHN|nr:NlpC/P60 family protein [Sphingobium ummariense]EQB32453.1 glycoside hydrolase [Sphingobium ummariense RL-3]